MTAMSDLGETLITLGLDARVYIFLMILLTILKVIGILISSIR